MCYTVRVSEVGNISYEVHDADIVWFMKESHNTINSRLLKDVLVAMTLTATTITVLLLLLL